MINLPTVKNIVEQNTTIESNVGCTIEYNMNSMVDNITVTGTEYTRADGSKPYKKLFPASSVIKAFRPVGAGVKYGVIGDVSTNTWRDPKDIDYNLDYRTYYPGIDTYYKYYLTQKGVGADITITYNGQTILTNKIVVRFEISHSIPTTWTIFKEGNAQLATGTNTAIKPFLTSGSKNYDSGTLTLYYNGTSWVTTEPSTISAPISITSLRLTTGAVSGAHIGVIELSPRWIADLTPHITNFSTSQESSTSADDILPVGKVSANSMSASLISYESPRKIISYEKGTAFSSSYLYMYKGVELTPYIKVYYSNAAFTDSKGTYEKVKQGTFYIDTWDTSEFGNINIRALDGAKSLQDIIVPGMVCKDTSAIGIIRRLLDNVGFTNYKINYKKETQNGVVVITDKSILSPIYWWTDDSETVWNAIQELCRDSQMVATFDENNILQFYTRDYLFSQTTAHWNFKYAKDGSILPNIISLNKTDLPAINQVKILWNPVTASELLGSAQPLWKSGTSYLGAYSLNTPLTQNAGAGEYISVSPIVVNQGIKQIIYNYSGYLVIDSEIIEYDAIEYHYVSLAGTKKTIPVQQISDLQKIANDRSSSLPANQSIGQTGRIRIKSRGAFGTTPAAHTAAGEGAKVGWAGYNNIFKSNGDSGSPSYTSSDIIASVATPPSLDSVPSETTSSVKEIQKSLFKITSDSSDKQLHSVAVKNMSIAYTGEYYTFGTGMFFKSTVKDVSAAGGIGFFTSSNGSDGYYVSLETTANSVKSGADKALGIFKIKNGIMTSLSDSQSDDNKTLAFLTGSTSYKVDIRVKHDAVNSVIAIDVFINGFKITAADASDIITPSPNIAIYSRTGSTFFDYVYAIPLSKDQYDNGLFKDRYYGRFGSTTLNFLYGEKLTSSFDNTGISGGTVDEFGTVAREIRKIDVKYDSRPAFPVFASVGLSQYVEVLGSRLTSFGAEIYVVNNAGTFIPLDDSQFASFSVIGNTVVQSGQNEYLDKTINEFTNPEQATFESAWIQREEDAKNLSDWIKNQWSKKQSVCELEIFSNPLISVGDLVTINYPANGFDGTQKFIVSNINNTFEGGLNTNITARSIYSQ